MSQHNLATLQMLHGEGVDYADEGSDLANSQQHARANPPTPARSQHGSRLPSSISPPRPPPPYHFDHPTTPQMPQTSSGLMVNNYFIVNSPIGRPNRQSVAVSRVPLASGVVGALRSLYLEHSTLQAIIHELQTQTTGTQNWTTLFHDLGVDDDIIPILLDIVGQVNVSSPDVFT